MNMLLSIGLLFIYGMAPVASSPALISREVADMINLPNFHLKFSETPGSRLKRWAKKPDLSWINELRRRVAKDANIANMPDLHWNESLAAEARDMDRKCENVKHGANYRYFMSEPDANAQKLVARRFAILFNEPWGNMPEKARAGARAHFMSDPNSFSLMILELFNPLQTQLGCDWSKCDGQIQKFQYTFNYMCAIGSSNIWPEELLPNFEERKEVPPQTPNRQSDVEHEHNDHHDHLPQTEQPRKASGSTALFQITLLLIIIIIIFAYFCSIRQKQVSCEPKLLENDMYI